jgi:protein SCO1/2
MKAMLTGICAILLACSLFAAHAVAADRPARSGNPVTQEEGNRTYFTDLPVMTHDGKTHRFYSDLMKGKIVLIGFYYTTCPSLDPAIATLHALQKELGKNGDDRFVILWVSVDPEQDTLTAVQALAERVKPGKGWKMVTAEKEHLKVINRKLGHTKSDPDQHPRYFMLGNPAKGSWMKMAETAPAKSIAEALRKLAEEK